MLNMYARSITAYCERVGDSFWAEPINFLSNAAFFISAFFAFKFLKEHNLFKEFGILVWILVFMGFGSALWHSLRTPLTHVLDFVPVFAFLLVFLFFVLAKLLKNKTKALLLTVAFLLIQILLSFVFPALFNGSIRHFVSAIIFVGLVFWLAKKSPQSVPTALTVLLAYAFGIIFRSIDNTVCLQFPLGTHFLWHICTATATYFSVKTLVKLRS